MRAKKIFYLVFICLGFSTTVFSQNFTRQEYILRYQDLAIREMARSGIPASITMAQACLESADGNSELSRTSNNHFGIKCKSDWKGQRVYYDDDRKNECFRSYRTVEDSYRDHTDFLVGNYRYAFLFDYSMTDYEAWAKGLKQAGYATSLSYANQLIEIIEEYELYRLDDKYTFDELANFETLSLGRGIVNNNMIINPYQSREVKIRNGLKTVVVKEGDSFEIIAQEFGLKAWELFSYNDYPKGYKPQPNEIIYIQPKKRRTGKNNLIHIVQPGESFHYISQLYGIRLRPLYRRNRMDFGAQPVEGQAIYLRDKIKK